MFIYTKSQLKEIQYQALLDLIDYAGGTHHLAFMLGKPIPTINSWAKRKMISKEGAAEVASHPTLGKEFPLERTRPEIAVKNQ
jgi:hypothetical protein